MQIETLKMFCDLVDTGSFTRSAVINGVTQSAVSQQISALERAYKTPLLDRQLGSKRVRLTHKGQVLYDSAKKILAVYDSMNSQMKDEPVKSQENRASASPKSAKATLVALRPEDLQI